MKCSKCGYEYEGNVCPKCGTTRLPEIKIVLSDEAISEPVFTGKEIPEEVKIPKTTKVKATTTKNKEPKVEKVETPVVVTIEQEEPKVEQPIVEQPLPKDEVQVEDEFKTPKNIKMAKLVHKNGFRIFTYIWWLICGLIPLIGGMLMSMDGLLLFAESANYEVGTAEYEALILTGGFTFLGGLFVIAIVLIFILISLILSYAVFFRITPKTKIKTLRNARAAYIVTSWFTFFASILFLFIPFILAVISLRRLKKIKDEAMDYLLSHGYNYSNIKKARLGEYFEKLDKLYKEVK